jgi:hypothetical protein
MKLGFAFDQVCQRLKQNSHALWYVSAQLAAKAMAAAAQLYAIYVFSKILAPNDAALIFIIFGYGVWIQIFEFGLSQVIQNTLNAKQTTVSGVCLIVSLHYAVMIVLAVLVLIFPEALDLLQGGRRVHGEGINALAFPFGIALLLVSTNNVLVQRLLLVINRAMAASKLLFFQGVFSVLVLSVLQWRGANFIESVSTYLSIPILTFAPLALKIARKALRDREKLIVNWQLVLSNAAGFWGLTAMSSVYLGSDYFFAARYLTNAEMTAYHFSSRLFFISYVAYFSYVQFKAKSITSETSITHPQQIWIVTKGAAGIGIFSVVLVLVATICIDWSGALDMIGAHGFVVTQLILPAALYYAVRVFRDVGLVLVWNLGCQRLLYAVHVLEVALCLLLLNVLAPELGGKGIFFAMALVAAFSTAVIYIALGRVSLRLS